MNPETEEDAYILSQEQIVRAQMVEALSDEVTTGTTSAEQLPDMSVGWYSTPQDEHDDASMKD